MNRYDLAPLLEALRLPPDALTQLADRLGTDERHIRRARTTGLRWDAAERHAITIGHHPATLWPHWSTDLPRRLTDADWFTDDPPLDQLDQPPADRPPLQPTLVA